MKNDIKIYLLLFMFVALQVFAMSRLCLFPDIIITIVVYAGVFYNMKNVLLIAFTAGFLRGVFSPETMSVDIAVFPLIGVLSYGIGKLFNRNTPVGGVLITIICLLFLISTHAVVLSVVNNNSVSISLMLIRYWKIVIISAAAYPLVYFIFNIFLKKEKYSTDYQRIFY